MSMNRERILTTVEVLALFLGCQLGAQGEEVDFSRDIRPLFNEHCVQCHGGVKQVRELSFIYSESVFTPAKSGEVPVVPGKPEESELMRRVTHSDEDERMPPPEHGPRLSEQEISLFRRWIKQGADWEKHWAFRAPQKQSLPEVKHEEWPRQPIDYFILNRLEKEGFEPSEDAKRAQWLRRVKLDLTGLPPTPKEVAAFQSDTSRNAYKKVVDRLLASPAFGERWASVWLDLARYADSQGYEKDGLRTMWPYRDWLIRAINKDIPYDEFAIQQLAGDLLPKPSMNQMIATAFHRNTPTNTEGGTDDEEFRVAAVIDRVNTTWQVWQGLTFGCAQCHSHPYDPIRHKEYYQFYSLFNTTRDWDLRSEEPKLDIPLDRSKFEEARELDRKIRSLKEDQIERVQEIAAKRDQWQALEPVYADSTQQTKLEVQENDKGIPEVFARGTVSHDSRFTLEFPLPKNLEELTALRIDVSPKAPDKAKFTPELGFAISHLRAQIVTKETDVKIPGPKEKESKEEESSKDSSKEKDSPKNIPGEISLKYALGDALESIDDPQASLNEDSKQGWGAIPRLTHRRHLVVVPEKPVAVPKGARLRLVIRQERAPNDLDPLVMDRSHYSVTGNSEWSELVDGESFQSRRSKIASLGQKRASIESADLPIMREQDPHLKRRSAVFVRGNWQSKGEPVSAEIPDVFGDLPDDKPKNRLALARWLVSKDNPLTARVAVNRIWEQIFGTGLVKTTGNFGSSGARPSHPKLLDYLALRFQNELDWSRKALLREIVLSATYRQTARVTPELKKRDPENRLLARGPRTRLTAEMVRDNALAVSGLLSRKMYGEPIMPPQPDGIWRAARSGLKWEESKGKDKYRRAVYVMWRRSSPYPSMLTFDAPSRLVCNTRRKTTNTPLQALVTLNDPVFVEAASALAKRVKRSSQGGYEEQLSRAYELAVGTEPSKANLNDLKELYNTALEKYNSNPEAAEEMGGRPKVAALATVGSAILNLDKVLMR